MLAIEAAASGVTLVLTDIRGCREVGDDGPQRDSQEEEHDDPAGHPRSRPHPVGKRDARLRHVSAHERDERPSERDESERVDVTGQPGERCRQADQRPAVSRHPTSSVQLSLLVRSS